MDTADDVTDVSMSLDITECPSARKSPGTLTEDDLSNDDISNNPSPVRGDIKEDSPASQKTVESDSLETSPDNKS